MPAKRLDHPSAAADAQIHPFLVSQDSLPSRPDRYLASMSSTPRSDMNIRGKLPHARGQRAHMLRASGTGWDPELLGCGVCFPTMSLCAWTGARLTLTAWMWRKTFSESNPLGPDPAPSVRAGRHRQASIYNHSTALPDPDALAQVAPVKRLFRNIRADGIRGTPYLQQ